MTPSPEDQLFDELQEAKAEIAKLKADLVAWKDAWFSQRDLIGKIMWKHTNCSLESIPEGLFPPNWWDNTSEEFVRVDTRVYQRMQSEWKLIAQGCSVDAAEAVIRLMKVGKTND